MAEQQLQTKICEFLCSEGFWEIKIVVATKGGNGDIVACSPTGQFWMVEVKDEGEKPKALQKYKLKEIRKREGVAFWCDSFEMFLANYRQNYC